MKIGFSHLESKIQTVDSRELFVLKVLKNVSGVQVQSMITDKHQTQSRNKNCSDSFFTNEMTSRVIPASSTLPIVAVIGHSYQSTIVLDTAKRWQVRVVMKDLEKALSSREVTLAKVSRHKARVPCI